MKTKIKNRYICNVDIKGIEQQRSFMIMMMMILFKLLRMLVYPWNKELNNYTS